MRPIVVRSRITHLAEAVRLLILRWSEHRSRRSAAVDAISPDIERYVSPQFEEFMANFLSAAQKTPQPV